MIRSALLVGLFLAAAAPATAQSDGNRIYPGDKLQLRITEWMPAQGTFKIWDGIGGPHVVGKRQAIDIPFVGSLSTTDRSIEDLADEVSDALYRQLSLSGRPDVTVTFAERANIYVTGGVQTPGPIPFGADLTAQKAIAAAGGFYRESSGVMRLERDAISAQGAIDLARYKAARSIARLERLQSEIDDVASIEIDASAWPLEVPAEMIEEERALMRIRVESRDLRLRSIENITQLATQQLTSLRAKAKNLDRQIALTAEELAGVRSLVDRGLAVSGRSFSLELTLADLEGRRIDVDQSILQAELQASQAERDAIDVRTTFQSSASNDLQDTRTELQENINSIEVAQGLLTEARVIAPEQILDRDGNLRFDVQIFLSRESDGTTTRMEIAGTDKVQPGDLIEVQLRRSDKAPVGTVDLTQSGSPRTLQ